MSAPKPAYTEADVLKALRKRHSAVSGNGPEWAYLEHVRNSAGFHATRTLDAMAMHLWPSRGMELQGFEVKTSRADFRREIADVEKMDAFFEFLDRFWIVAPVGVVPEGEIPATWGLLELRSNGTLVTKVAAPLLRKERADIPRHFLVPMLRAAGAGLAFTPDEAAIRDARAEGERVGEERANRSNEGYKRLYEGIVEREREYHHALASIDVALGSKMGALGFTAEQRAEHVATVASTVKAVLAGEDVVSMATQRIQIAMGDLGRAKGVIEGAERAITQSTGVTIE